MFVSFGSLGLGIGMFVNAPAHLPATVVNLIIPHFYKVKCISYLLRSITDNDSKSIA